MCKTETLTKLNDDGPYLINRVNFNPNLTIEEHISSFLNVNKDYKYIAQNRNGCIYAYINKPRSNNEIFISKTKKCLIGYSDNLKIFTNWKNSLVDLSKDEFYIGSEYELYRIRVDKRN